MIALNHQTKTSIDFWYRRWLNPRSLIQPLETLPVMLIKAHHYNYSIEGMRNKINTTLEEYYRIKVDIKYIFLFLFNSKAKFTYGFLISTSQTPMINHSLYKTHKYTVLFAMVTQYKILAWVASFSCCIQLTCVKTKWDNNVEIRYVSSKDCKYMTHFLLVYI